MGRTLKNTLTEAELLDEYARRTVSDVAEILARYGADLLGRAIGHEQAHETRKGLPATMFYSNLIHDLDHTATRKIMAFNSAREVQAL